MQQPPKGATSPFIVSWFAIKEGLGVAAPSSKCCLTVGLHVTPRSPASLFRRRGGRGSVVDSGTTAGLVPLPARSFVSSGLDFQMA